MTDRCTYEHLWLLYGPTKWYACHSFFITNADSVVRAMKHSATGPTDPVQWCNPGVADIPPGGAITVHGAYWSGRRIGASMREMVGLDELASMVRRRQSKGERKRNRWRPQ